MKIFKTISILAAAIFLSACQSPQRKVLVLDAETNVPISGAIVYASSADMLDVFGFGTCGLYKTDAQGETFVDEKCRVLSVLAAKEGYEYKHGYDENNIGNSIVATVKLPKEKSAIRHRAKVEPFKTFPDDAKTQAIAKELREYFAKRNVMMTTYGESCVIETKITVRDYKTKRPIPNAMILIRQHSHTSGHIETIVATDESGIASVSLELSYLSLFIDAGKEGYFPTKKYDKDLYKHGRITVELDTKRKPNDNGLLRTIVSDTSGFSRRPTNIPLWERYKAYYQKVGGSIVYVSETR